MKDVRATILVVDGDQHDINHITTILHDLQYAVQSSQTGAQALAEFTARPSDMLLLNVSLSDMSGYEVCQQVKRLDIGSEIPVIFMSEQHKHAERLNAFSCGGADYIIKPFQEADVLTRIETHLAFRSLQHRVKIQQAQLQEEISKRQEMEKALHLSRQYADNVINCSLDMIITVDIDRRITLFNEAAQETFGYTSEEVLGQHVSLLYADTDEAFVTFQQTFQVGQCVREIYNKRKNGELFPCLLAASILYNGDDGPIGFMGISRDITTRKQAEADIRRRNQELSFINRATQVFNSTLELKYVFHTILQEMHNVLDIMGTSLWLYDSEPEMLICQSEQDIFEAMQKHLGVRYQQYEEDIPSPSSDTSPTSEALSRLPAEWLVTLRQGAQEANPTRLLEIIAQIYEHDEALADALTRLTEDFEYDMILDILPRPDADSRPFTRIE